LTYLFNGGGAEKVITLLNNISQTKKQCLGHKKRMFYTIFTLFEASKGVGYDAFKTRLYEVKGYKEQNLFIAPAALYHKLIKIHYSFFSRTRSTVIR
jgi:hypothetical protein